MSIIFLRIDVGGAMRQITALSVGTVAGASLLYGLALLVAAAKWRLLVPSHGFALLLKIVLIAQFYTLVLPGQIAGEAAKAYRLARHSGHAAEIAASVLVDRITGLFGLLILAVTAIFASSSAISPALSTLLAAGLAILVVVPLAMTNSHLEALCEKSSRAILEIFPFSERTLPFAAAAGSAWKRFIRSPLLLAKSIALGVAYQALSTGVTIVIARNLGISVPVWDWFWIFGIVSIVTLAPFTVGGIGLREASFIGVLATLGVDSELALALSLCIFGVLLIGAAMGAVADWRLAASCPPGGEAG